MEQVLAGRYALETEIDRGAIGTVWRARDLTTGELVAVKVLLPETAHDADVVKSLLDEAEILNQLDHPSIVRPRDFVANGLRALVMDLVEGIDVRKRLRTGGPLRPAEVVEIGAQIADALASVHAAGILHGDVKPGNIMVPADGGHAKLVDFGVARRIQLPDTVTHATPEYVAPEVVAGEKPTAASDVYSLGMVLYEMTCGRSPYRGGSVLEVVERHSACVPVQPAGMADELWTQVLRCVEIEPGNRPGAAELAAELRRLAPTLIGRSAAMTIPEYATTYRPRLVDPADADAPVVHRGEPLWPEAGQPGTAGPAIAAGLASTPGPVGPASPVGPAGPEAAGPPRQVSASPVSNVDPVSAFPVANPPVSAGPGAGVPVSPATGDGGAGEPDGGSVLSLFGTPPDPATQVIGAVPVPPENPSGGRGRMAAFLGVAAALVVLLALGAGLLIWSSTGSPEPVANKDPVPAPTKSSGEPEPSSSTPSPSTTPSEPPASPTRPQPAPPTEDGGNDGGDNGDGGSDDGRPGLGDPMPTMPGG
ncbi:MAG: protein kinase domain-containing protein [Micromonosporaceae bacterium]